MINEIGINNIYGKYLGMLGLVMKSYSISFQLIGNLSLPLLYDLKLTVVTKSLSMIIYQPSHQESESNSENTIKFVVKRIFSLQII